MAESATTTYSIAGIMTSVHACVSVWVFSGLAEYIHSILICAGLPPNLPVSTTFVRSTLGMAKPVLGPLGAAYAGLTPIWTPQNAP